MPPKLSNVTICYQAIQRVYRNAVVEYLRGVLGKRFGHQYEDRVKGVFKKEWEDIAVAANERRLTGELESKLVDNLDVLGVNHFYNLFEAFYFDIFPEEKTSHPAQMKSNRSTLLAWAKSVKNLRDPLSHPAEEDYSFLDSLAMLDPARRVLLRLRCTRASEEVHEWMKELKSLSEPDAGDPDEAIQPLESNLPPSETIAVDFIGRTRELTALENWFEDPLARRWALAGEGGKGKSAIAYHFASQVVAKAPTPYQLVVWLSAKKRRFDEGETVQISSPDFSDLNSALDYILRTFGWSEFTIEKLDSKRATVLKLLDEFPALIVVDDADTLEGLSEDAAEFFALELPRTKSKVILTSRRVLFGMGNTTTHVSGLEGLEAQDFISSRCRLTELDFNSVKPHIADILKLTEGSPLYLEDLLRLCSIMPVAGAIQAWRSQSGDSARGYALGRELDLLSQHARDVLIAACIPGKPVSHSDIEAMLGHSSEQVASALRELQKLFLVPKPALFEGEERYNVNINTRLLVKKIEGESDGWRRIEHAWINITKGVATGRDEIVGAAIRRATLQVRARQHGSAETTLLRALQLRPSHPNLFGFLGWVYKSCDPRRVTDARAAFDRGRQLGCKDPKMFVHWAGMEIDLKEWSKAATAAEYGLAIDEKNYELLHWAGYARHRLGKELQNRLHGEKALSELTRAKSHLLLAIEGPDGAVPRPETFRTLVLVAETLNDKSLLSWAFGEWQAAYPHDLAAKSEWVRLSAKFSLAS